MALTFLDMQTEVKRRAMKNQAGTTFDVAIKTAINNALFRTAREGAWRCLRRKTTFDTVASYTKGSGAVTNAYTSTSFSVTGATFLTDGVKVGRYIKFGGSSEYYKIATISSNTAGTLDRLYQGSDDTDDTYEIFPQEEYNLPVQVGHKCFLWHEDYGYPYKLGYVTDQDFYDSGINPTTKGSPECYRMWGEDMVISQPPSSSVMDIYSSSLYDTATQLTVFGMVSNYPDSEVIALSSSDSTVKTKGSKSFSSIDRVVKNSTTLGRVTVLSSATQFQVTVLPAGDITAGIHYSKIQLYPLPNKVFPVTVQYYKEPYRLVADGDVHELGQEFDEAIILLATAKMLFESSKDDSDKYMVLWQDEVRNLKRTNVDKIDWFPTLRPAFTTNSNDYIHPYLSLRQVGSYYGRRA